MAFERSVSFRIDGGDEVALRLRWDDRGPAEGPPRGDLTVDVMVRGREVSVRWHADPLAQAFLLDPGTVLSDPTAQCIAKCLGVAIGQSLLECLIKARNRAELEKCLKDNAVGALIGAATCIARCLGIL